MTQDFMRSDAIKAVLGGMALTTAALVYRQDVAALEEAVRTEGEEARAAEDRIARGYTPDRDRLIEPECVTRKRGAPLPRQAAPARPRRWADRIPEEERGVTRGTALPAHIMAAKHGIHEKTLALRVERGVQHGRWKRRKVTKADAARLGRSVAGKTYVYWVEPIRKVTRDAGWSSDTAVRFSTILRDWGISKGCALNRFKPERWLDWKSRPSTQEDRARLGGNMRRNEAVFWVEAEADEKYNLGGA